jgi:hypothetical protein
MTAATALPADLGPASESGLAAVKSALLLTGTAFLALALYYFIGIDQGMTSLFGNDMHIHEFVHDARHSLGFPCH